MARFKTEKFVFEDPQNRGAELRFQFKADVQIASDGTFYLNLPEGIADTLSEAGVRAGDPISSDRRHGKITADTYKALLHEVSFLFTEFYSKELISEQILLEYFISTSVSYCKCNDGELVPNGGWQLEKDGRYDWIHGVGNETFIKGSGLSIYCRPINRKVFQYKSGKQLVKDESISTEGLTKKDPLLWLASRPENLDRWNVSFHYIDATPEVCAFFVGLYKSLWSLNERIKEMTSPEQIARLAESKTKFLL